MHDLDSAFQYRHVLQIYQQDEEIVDFKCYDCGIPEGEKEPKNQTCTRRLQLLELPEVLVVVLGRFHNVKQGSAYFIKKLQTPVTFPQDGWDLTSYVRGQQGSPHFSMLACMSA